ncbi:BH3954 [Halalkalibacterium halodurans C-125]|uniref:BH3954 protein n=1 Tax=Halalkalibacterium halodurans (strain ATCC BAA-125 / DSM 18197 / FERM 7344 / JCM 9153 / C-125) TaxID=272558 RepID=Q9K5Y2_HALH5|nr:BH3954 [Halalkalibacterium halodurans C-125]
MFFVLKGWPDYFEKVFGKQWCRYSCWHAS